MHKKSIFTVSLGMILAAAFALPMNLAPNSAHASNMHFASQTTNINSEQSSASSVVIGENKTRSTLKSSKPKISGVKKVGKKLSVKTGKWASGTKFSYQWKANGKNIRGATKKTLVLKPSQMHKRVSVAVKGTKKGFKSVTKVSAAPKIGRGILKSSKPKISGVKKVSKNLTAKKGSWTSGTTVTYQWLRNGKKINGATKANYKVKNADAGKKISVRVKGTKNAYASKTRVSSTTRIAKLKPKSSPASNPAPTPSTQTPVSNPSTYYKNCTEARNAGAAPVYINDPGYGTHLDRDRDGIGCE